MTTAIKRRRGTTAQHSTFTGLEGELTVDTTKETVVVHDGATAGGFPLARETLENAKTTNLTDIAGSATASDDTFLIYDTSAAVMKKITRAELNNAIEVDALANVTITGGTINGTSVGATTRSTGAFTTLASNGATTFTAGTASTSTTTGTAVITGGLGVSGRINAANFDGIVGANTAAAGSFTTLSASSTVSGTGFSTYLASPPAIGGTAAAAGNFTTLGASSTATLNTLASSGATLTGGSINGMAIGGTTRAAGSFTTVTTTNDASISGLTVGKGAGAVVGNTAVGASALLANTTGSTNSAFGQFALFANTTGNDNTGLGRSAMESNTTGLADTAVGRNALYSNTTGNYNVAVGVQSLFSNTTASNNTAVGFQAGYSNTTGVNNTFVGVLAGANMTTGAKNTIIGRYDGNLSGLDIRTASNYIVLSDGDGNVEFTAKDGSSWALPGATVQTGTGITFPATQSASSNANTLDDYEEGSWTPNQGAGLTVIGAFSSSGIYTKIGRVVNVIGTVTGATSVSVAAAGVITNNLPFSCVRETSGVSVGSSVTVSAANAASGVNVYSAGAISAVGSIWFSITYSV